MSEVPNGNALRSAKSSSYHAIINKLRRQLDKGEGEQALEWQPVDIADAKKVEQEIDRTLEHRSIRYYLLPL
jgi:hypothetical protein